MKTSLLVDYLLGRGEPGAVRAAIAPAIARRRAQPGAGGPFPVLLQDDGGELIVAAEHVRRLCRDYLALEFDAIELGYVAAVIELSPSFTFAGEPARLAVSVLADARENTARLRNIVRETMLDLF